MGVPAFFRWLTKKYPSVIAHCVEQKTVDINGVAIPIDSSEPNPNGVEFDNLYLDMNGIIHPCTHPEDKPAPRNEDEMMVAIFECIDRLFKIVRPRKLLYMAIDGVAPRAKMNQQRSRRFRSIKESVEKFNEIRRARAELLLKGATLPPEKEQGEHFDSNCITPGTPFMARLSDCLHYYVHDRLNNDPGWKDVKVILSDANVPGEGEHKIMDYIRKQRAQPDHDPNTHHCMCGADADLIMLGLATHEVNFTIIREEFKPNKPRPCDLCGQIGHDYKECSGGENAANADQIPFSAEQEFIFVRLNVLREYLERELEMPNLPFKYEFERAIDDWVLMCFFVGNDFLPHLPSLEIREGAIDRLVKLYKDAVYKTGGYLTENGDVNLERVQLIMSQLGKAEDEIFRKRHESELYFKNRDKQRKKNQNYDYNFARNTQFAPQAIGAVIRPVRNARNEMYQIRKAGMHTAVDHDLQGVQQKTALESMLVSDDSGSVASGSSRGQKRSHDEVEKEEEEDEANDEVRLWEDGFKNRYYESKFDIEADNLEFRYSVALQYVKGLCWVLQYYYQGCPSWKWYFPYHYAPFASDFVNIGGLSTKFEKGTKPFNPLEQLMSVFPAPSRSHVPEAWGDLMLNEDSPIIDFYPEDFKIDLNGKKFAWQGVALLPFVDETRLFRTLAEVYDKLTFAEKERNSLGDERLYIGSQHEQYTMLKELYVQKTDPNLETAVSIDGIQGTILLCNKRVKHGKSLESPIQCLPPVEGNHVCCVNYRCVTYPEDFVFTSTKLKGANLPPRVLKPQDFEQQEGNKSWRPYIGMARSNTRANVGEAGHRMLNHHTGGNYSNVPPPQYGNQSRGYNSRGNRGNYQGNSYQDNRNRGGYQSYNQRSNQGYNTEGGNYRQQGNFNNRGHGNDGNSGNFRQGGHSRFSQDGGSGGNFRQQRQGYQGRGGGQSRGNQDYGGQQNQQFGPRRGQYIPNKDNFSR